MTLAAATTRDDYVATSGQTVFPYTFTALVDSDVDVLKNGIALTLGAGNDYTISGIGTGSGNVTLNVGAATGDKIAIYLDMPIARTTNYQNSGAFLALDVNGDMNKAYLAMQQITTDMQAAIRRPEADPATIGMELPVAATRAQKLLAFDINGAVKVEPYLNNETVVLNVQDEIGDGVTTTYSLATSVNSPTLLQIAINGLLQEVSSYSVVGGNVIFSVAPPFQSAIEIRAFIQKEITSTDLTISEFAGNGSTTSFVLGASAVKQNTFVYINGVYQFKSTYSVSGATITFSTAPPANSGIEVVTAGFTTSVINTPSANSVGTVQIQDNAVTQSKIADDAVGADQLASNAVVTASIADNAVTTAKIADANVTTAKIADDAVTAAKIASVPITVGITSVVTATSLTATVNTHVYVSAATKTITLPASPAIGQRVLITVGNFTDTVVARNGSNIMSSATDFTMDAAYLSIQFIWVDITRGWVMS
jgi:hypothetical protein